MNVKKSLCAWMLAMAGVLVAADQDAALREAQRRERGGQAAEAAKVFRNVYGDAQAPAHQRLAALCGLLRTDTARLAEWSRTGLGSKDERWSGTVAQALALLPPDRIESARAAWMKQLPPAALLKVMRAVVHVKSPAAKAFLADALAKCADPAVRRFALEGTGRLRALPPPRERAGGLAPHDARRLPRRLGGVPPQPHARVRPRVADLPAGRRRDEAPEAEQPRAVDAVTGNCRN